VLLCIIPEHYKGTSKNSWFRQKLCWRWSGNFWKPFGERAEGPFVRGSLAYARLLPLLLGYENLLQPRKHEDPMEIIRELLPPNLETSSNQPNSANPLATHHGDLMAEDLFDARAYESGLGCAPSVMSSRAYGATPCRESSSAGASP